MDKIKKYVEKFFSKTGRNIRFGLKYDECLALVNEIRRPDGNAFSTASMLFDYGYAKGYKACQSEMKKGKAVQHERSR